MSFISDSSICCWTAALLVEIWVCLQNQDSSQFHTVLCWYRTLTLAMCHPGLILPHSRCINSLAAPQTGIHKLLGDKSEYITAATIMLCNCNSFNLIQYCTVCWSTLKTITIAAFSASVCSQRWQQPSSHLLVSPTLTHQLSLIPIKFCCWKVIWKCNHT